MGLQGPHCGHHLQPSPHSPLSVVLVGLGIQEQAIVGETPNLAARLQGVADPNSVVVAESTRKLVGNLFELQDLGAQDLKGIAGPVA